MKICIVCQNIQTLGGLQVVVTEVARYLRLTKKADITLLMPKLTGKGCFNLPQNFPIEIVELDNFMPVENQKYKRVIRTLNRNTACFDFQLFAPIMKHMLFSSMSINRLAEFINTQKFDWVIGTAFNYSLLVAFISDKVSCKTAGWMHSTFQGYYGIRGVAYYGLKNVNRKYLKRLDTLFVLNQVDKMNFDKNYGLNSIVLHNPIQQSSVNTNIHKKGELLFVGRLNKRVKGLDFLVEIMVLLKKDDVDFHLTVVGFGEDEKWFKERIKENNLNSNVTFAGFQQNVNPYYEKAYILLSTSRWEGFGMAIVEAMNAGTPCISFDHDGACEIIEDGESGILIPKYEVGNFKLAIKTLFSNDDNWEKMSLAAIEHAKKFNVDIIAEELYKNLEDRLEKEKK